MKLHEAIATIQYDSSWGIWVEEPITPQSNARFGQCQFDNGGVLDGKVFFCDGEQAGNFWQRYTECDNEHFSEVEVCQAMIDEA